MYWVEGYADMTKEFSFHCLIINKCYVHQVQSNYVDMASNDRRQQCMHVIDPKSNNVAEKHLYHWTKIMRSQVETTRIHRMEHQHNGIVPFIRKQMSMIEVFLL